MKENMMKKMLLAVAAIFVAGTVCATETLTTGETVSLTQGTEYTISGISDYYLSPDYFTPRGDDVYRFNAVSGSYKIELKTLNGDIKYADVYAMKDETEKATVNEGAVWLIGYAVGPATWKNSEGNKLNWDPARAICLAQVSNRVYQFTATNMTEIISAFDFRLFGQGGWGKQFYKKPTAEQNYLYSNLSNWLQLYGEGNIKMADGKSLYKGDKVVFTFDFTKGWDDGSISLEVTPADQQPLFDGVDMTYTNKRRFTYFGDFVQGNHYVASGNDAMNADDWYIDNDYFKRNDDGSLTFLPISGRYGVEADFGKKYFHVYPATAGDEPQTLQSDGTGALWLIGATGSVTKPAITNFSGSDWYPTMEPIALAPIAEKTYQVTLVAGREINKDGINMKFFGQKGWGSSELKSANLSTESTYVTIISTEGSDGNLNGGADVSQIKDGDALVFTVTLTSSTSGVLTVEKYNSVNIIGARYATFSCSQTIDFSQTEGITAYIAKKTGENTLTLTPVEKVPANTAVIVEGSVNNYILKTTDGATDNVSDNELEVSNGSITGEAGNIYVLANKSHGVGFYKLKSSATVPAGKAYLQIPAESPAPEFLGFGMVEGDVTGIERLNDSRELKTGIIYNLNGQRISLPAKGLYIVNGKKVVIK